MLNGQMIYFTYIREFINSKYHHAFCFSAKFGDTLLKNKIAFWNLDV